MARFADNPHKMMAWNAFMAFLPGAYMVYAGAEAAAVETPSLFDFEPVDWAPGLNSDDLRDDHTTRFVFSAFYTSVNAMHKALSEWANDPVHNARFCVVSSSPMVAVWVSEAGDDRKVLLARAHLKLSRVLRNATHRRVWTSLTSGEVGRTRRRLCS